MEVTSQMLELGTMAPDFTLLDVVSNKELSLKDVAGEKGLLVAFICNHCPFVVHVQEELSRLSKEYPPRGIAMVGICSNNIDTHPADSPEKMALRAKEADYHFPYLHDATQDVAKSYKAACTPDLFLFDGDLRLYYRGQIDDSRPSNGMEVTGKDIREAMESMLALKPAPSLQKPSIGCNIKWKPGNAPDYFG